MTKITDHLFIGSAQEFENNKKLFTNENWAVVHACKEPYHRNLLNYVSFGAPKSHPEYLIARRGDVLYLNLVDAPKPEYIPKEIITTALAFIAENISKGKEVFVHCNLGMSRAPSIGLLYLVLTKKLSGTPEEIIQEFEKIYPNYTPGLGMKMFVKNELRNL